MLAPLWAAAMGQCHFAAARVDWYVQDSAGVNAFAVGGRSVAVTTAIVAEFRTGRLSEEAVRAVLIHELGHHASGSARFSLLSVWLAAPWRLVSRFALGMVLGFARRQRLVASAMAMLVVGFTIAGAARDGQWMTVSILGGLVSCGVAVPLVDAAISRAGERAADRYAVAAGAGYELACALRAMTTPAAPRAGWLARLVARHPPIERRIAALLSTT